MYAQEEAKKWNKRPAYFKFFFTTPPKTLVRWRHVYYRDHVAHIQADLVQTLSYKSLLDYGCCHARYIYGRVVDSKQPIALIVDLEPVQNGPTIDGIYESDLAKSCQVKRQTVAQLLEQLRVFGTAFLRRGRGRRYAWQSRHDGRSHFIVVAILVDGAG